MKDTRTIFDNYHEAISFAKKISNRVGKIKGLNKFERKTKKILILKDEHSSLFNELYQIINREFESKDNSGYKTNSFFKLPYFMERVNADPNSFPDNRG